MNKKFFLICLLSFFAMAGIQAQVKYLTKNAKISFVSKTALETIEASNGTAVAVLDPANGAVAFSVVVKGFVFDKALMQQHFNENYLESDKYPKAEFRGSISNAAGISYDKDGTFPVTVSGKLTMHGVTRDVTAAGKIKISEGLPTMESTFTVALADYNIQIPGVVADKVSKTVNITVAAAQMSKLGK